ncbi:MAG: DUF3054 domain-containing protein [Acidimicrobiia bacterium]|nr:DUF3054 domain-containing protein [Acidimicrobiia bacterium]
MKKWLLSYDLVSVLVFVIAGRSNHGAEESATGILHTAGPFLIALAIGWLAARAWQDPASLQTGARVLAVTVVGGLVLRRFVFDDGTQLAFLLVAAAFLTLFLMGWRLGAVVAGRRRRMAV